MLTIKEAKEIGIKACNDIIGYEFCKEHVAICNVYMKDGRIEFLEHRVPN